MSDTMRIDPELDNAALAVGSTDTDLLSAELIGPLAARSGLASAAAWWVGRAQAKRIVELWDEDRSFSVARSTRTRYLALALAAAVALLAGCGVQAADPKPDVDPSESPSPEFPPPPYDPVAFGPGTLDCESIEAWIPAEVWIDDDREIRRDFTDTTDTACYWSQPFAGREIEVDVKAATGNEWNTWEEEAQTVFDSRTESGGMAPLTGLGEAAAYVPHGSHVIGDLSGLDLVVREGNLVATFTIGAFDAFETDTASSLLNYRTTSFTALAPTLTGLAEQYLVGIGAENVAAADPAPLGEGEAAALPDICAEPGLDGFAPGDESAHADENRAWCHFTDAAAGADLWLHAETYLPLGQVLTATEQATWLMRQRLTDEESEPVDFGDEANFTVVGLEDDRRTYRFVIRVGNTILNGTYMSSNSELEVPAEAAAREAAAQLGSQLEELLADA